MSCAWCVICDGLGFHAPFGMCVGSLGSDALRLLFAMIIGIIAIVRAIVASVAIAISFHVVATVSVTFLALVMVVTVVIVCLASAVVVINSVIVI